MSLLLALASAGTMPAASGAGIGIHAGVVYNQIKQLAAAKTLTKDEATTAINTIGAQLTGLTVPTLLNDAQFAAAPSGLNGTALNIKVPVASMANADTAKAYVLDQIKTLTKGLTADQIKAIATVTVNGQAGGTLTNSNLQTVVQGIAAGLSQAEKDALISGLVDQFAEIKYTGTTGLIGAHAIYLHNFNNNFGLGALLEAFFEFSKNFKNKTSSAEFKDFTPRFGANILARFVYHISHNAFVGADAGLNITEFRYPNDKTKTTNNNNSSNQSSKWLWAPMARAVVGFNLSNNLVATITAGGAYGFSSQDFKEIGATNKVKYYMVQGNVGITYFFGAPAAAAV